MSVSKLQITSATVMGLPSWKRASGRRVKATHERSPGNSTLSTMRPYWELGSSREPTISDSNTSPMPAAGTPLITKGLSVSKVPSAESRTSPPRGALGFT